jgi:serine/threonine-protein kinase
MRPLEVDARSQQRQLPVQAAEFYSELGRCQRVENKPRVARLLFQRSLEVRRNTLEDIAGVVENLADLADLESDAGHTEAALQGFRNALAQLQASLGNRHPQAIDLQRRLCELERSVGQIVLAERDCHDALTLGLDLHGDEHPEYARALHDLAVKLLPQYEADDGPLSATQLRQWRQHLLNGGRAAGVQRGFVSSGGPEGAQHALQIVLRGARGGVEQSDLALLGFCAHLR